MKGLGKGIYYVYVDTSILRETRATWEESIAWRHIDDSEQSKGASVTSSSTQNIVIYFNLRGGGELP